MVDIYSCVYRDEASLFFETGKNLYEIKLGISGEVTRFINGNCVKSFPERKGIKILEDKFVEVRKFIELYFKTPSNELWWEIKHTVDGI